jgi:hypothetical protein
MSIEAYLVIAIVAFAILSFIVPPTIGAILRYRGKRVITCPETRHAAGVDVDVKHAALTAAIGNPDLRLRDCSRWPEHRDCGQECLLQIELAPEDCKVRNILGNWYRDKQCVLCAKTFGDIHFHDHKPALLGPDGRTVEWRDFRAEDIPAALETAKPVCWDCHMLKTLMREHPDLVIERPAREVHAAGK